MELESLKIKEDHHYMQTEMEVKKPGRDSQTIQEMLQEQKKIKRRKFLKPRFYPPLK